MFGILEFFCKLFLRNYSCKLSYSSQGMFLFYEYSMSRETSDLFNIGMGLLSLYNYSLTIYKYMYI